MSRTVEGEMTESLALSAKRALDEPKKELRAYWREKFDAAFASFEAATARQLLKRAREIVALCGAGHSFYPSHTLARIAAVEHMNAGFVAAVDKLGISAVPVKRDDFIAAIDKALA